MADDLASRLRSLRERRGWTVVDMAERTGIPKRTLDKYMLRSGANLPGFEALLAMAKGLGVSLDWLAFGNEFSGEGSDLLASVASELESLQYFETIMNRAREAGSSMVEGEELLGLTPEEWASDLAFRVGERAKKLATEGVTREELLLRRAASNERTNELFRDRVARKLPHPSEPNGKV